jgi:hypothetical protein
MRRRIDSTAGIQPMRIKKSTTENTEGAHSTNEKRDGAE